MINKERSFIRYFTATGGAHGRHDFHTPAQYARREDGNFRGAAERRRRASGGRRPHGGIRPQRPYQERDRTYRTRGLRRDRARSLPSGGGALGAACGAAEGGPHPKRIAE